MPRKDTQGALRTSRPIGELEITAEMIEAGGAVLLKWFPDSATRDYCRSVAAEVFEAMRVRAPA